MNGSSYATEHDNCLTSAAAQLLFYCKRKGKVSGIKKEKKQENAFFGYKKMSRIL